MRRLGLLLLLVACQRDGRDAIVTILSEGSGAPNEAPLEPATAGLTARSPGAWQRWSGELGGLLVKEVSGGNQPMAPTVGQGVALYRETRDGLVLHALDAPFDADARPILMVPQTVRVGMAWESEYGDGAVNRMEVLSHQRLVLPLGPADVWAIGEYQGSEVATTRWYAEGIGRVGTGNGEWASDYGYSEWILPEVGQADGEARLDPQELRNVLEIEDHGEGGHEVWGLSGAVIGGTLYGYMDGWDHPIGFTREIDHVLCARLDDTPAWVGTAGGGTVVVQDSIGCPLVTQTWVQPGSGTTFEGYTFVHAGMILPGVVDLLPVDRAGQVADYDDIVTGWVEDGGYRALKLQARGVSEAQFYEFDLSTPPPWESRLLTDGAPHRGIVTSGEFSVAGQWWVGATSRGPGEALHWAVIYPDGRVFRVTLDDDVVSGWVPVGVLPGAPSIVLSGTERLAYSITTDGRVFLLRVDPVSGDVSIDSLGAVRVEEPGGGYEFKGVIADPANPRTVYVAANATSVSSVPKWRSGLFIARLSGDAVPYLAPPSQLVGVAETFGGIGVCWPRSDEPFDGSAWTLRGGPVDLVAASGDCAVIAANTSAVDPAWIGAERAIDAKLPGIGDLRIGFPTGRSPGYELSRDHAVLRDGTILDLPGLRLDARGFPVSYRWSELSRVAFRDLGGYGLWVTGNAQDRDTAVENIGGGISTPPCPSTEYYASCVYAGPVVGGGALYLSPPPAALLQVIRPNGRVEDLPGLGTPLWGILLRDGRHCSWASLYPTAKLRCIDEHAGSWDIVMPTAMKSVREQFWEIADGTLLVMNDPTVGGTVRFDPASNAATMYDARALQGAVTASDGRVYAIARGADGSATVVEVTASGAVDLPTVDSPEAVVPVDGGLVVAGPHGWVRVPRP